MNIRRNPVATLGTLLALTAGLSSAQAATSSASTDFMLDVSFDQAVFVTGLNAGLPADLALDVEIDSYGYWETGDISTVNTGAGSYSENATLSIAGFPPDPSGDFIWSPGDVFGFHLMSDATATGAGASYGGIASGRANIGFQSYSDEDIELVFSFNWTRSLSLTNDTAGSTTSSLLDAMAVTGDYYFPEETAYFLDGDDPTLFANLGYSLVGTWDYTNGDSGSFVVSLPAYEYVSVTIAAEAWSLADVAPVPEAQTWAMMLGGLGLIGVMARRRRLYA